jgi:hypothetical protein
MATTTNYGWTTPDDTALVKDGAAAIRTLGSSVDTTTKNLNPSTTLGDIEYRSSTANTNTRLGIGSTGQVLTVAAGVPSWAASAGGGMTLISRVTFSNVASQAFDSVFTSSYDTYFVSIDDIYAATSTDDLHWQFRYAGPTTQTASYYSANFGYDFANTLTTTGTNNGSEFNLSTRTGTSGQGGSGQFYVTHVGNSSEYPVISGLFFNNPSQDQRVVGGKIDQPRIYTGFLLKSSSTNITGIVSIFGVNKI